MNQMPEETATPDAFTATWVVVAAYREAAIIQAVVAALRVLDWKVVVVDDGSPDATSEAARASGAVVLRHPINLG